MKLLPYTTTPLLPAPFDPTCPECNGEGRFECETGPPTPWFLDRYWTEECEECDGTGAAPCVHCGEPCDDDGRMTDDGPACAKCGKGEA